MAKLWFDAALSPLLVRLHVCWWVGIIDAYFFITFISCLGFKKIAHIYPTLLLASTKINTIPFFIFKNGIRFVSGYWCFALEACSVHLAIMIVFFSSAITLHYIGCCLFIWSIIHFVYLWLLCFVYLWLQVINFM